jgi:DNA-binding NarL/FixJ family response regulator
MTAKNLKVIIAEDHTLVREGFRSLLNDIDGVEVVGEAGDGRAALELTDKHKPDLILMDIAMPEMNGLEATAHVTKEFPDIHVIILSMYSTEEYVLQALRAGASAYLLKNADGTELETAIRADQRGETYLSQAISEHVAAYIRRAGSETSPLERLTLRQREILQLIAEGYSTKNIAAKLHLSEKTVETHRANLMKQLEIYDIPSLVRFAIRTGIITAEE